jgi:hypothetical protein
MYMYIFINLDSFFPIEGRKLVHPAQLPFIVYGESSMLHISTLHAGHLQAFTKGRNM